MLYEVITEVCKTMKLSVLLVLVLVSLAVNTVHAQYGYGKPPPPYGGDDDVNSAKSLWSALAREQLVGNKVIHSTPYQGIHRITSYNVCYTKLLRSASGCLC